LGVEHRLQVERNADFQAFNKRSLYVGLFSIWSLIIDVK